MSSACPNRLPVQLNCIIKPITDQLFIFCQCFHFLFSRQICNTLFGFLGSFVLGLCDLIHIIVIKNFYNSALRVGICGKDFLFLLLMLLPSQSSPPHRPCAIHLPHHHLCQGYLSPGQSGVEIQRYGSSLQISNSKSKRQGFDL